MVGWFLKNLKEKPRDPASKRIEDMYSNTYTPMFTNVHYPQEPKGRNNQMFRNRWRQNVAQTPKGHTSAIKIVLIHAITWVSLGAQIQVHCVGDAVSPSHSLLPPLLLPSIFSGIRVLSEARALTQHSKGAEASRQWQLKCPKTGPILENASLDRREKLERKKRGAMNLLAPQIKIQSHLVFFVTKPHVFFVLFFFLK